MRGNAAWGRYENETSVGAGELFLVPVMDGPRRLSGAKRRSMNKKFGCMAVLGGRNMDGEKREDQWRREDSKG